MRGGNNRKPKQQKIIQGTFRKDRSPKKEPEFELVAEVPKPPVWLNKEAKREWKRIAPELVNQGLLTTADLAALEVCCNAYGMYREAQQAIYRPIDPDTGKRRRRTLAEYLENRNAHTCPELTVMRQSYTQYKGLLAEFGLAPQSRNRIDLPQGGNKEVDPMERILNEA